MKSEELIADYCFDATDNQTKAVYPKADVDAAIAELKAENESLEEKNREYKAREDVLVTDNRDLLEKVKMLEERLRENAEHFKRNEAQILENADKVIADKDKEIAELKALNHDLCERVTENDEIRLHWEEIEQTRAENERMKARIAELEDERRWRKFPDEKPTKDIKFLVINEKGFLQCCYYSPILHEFQIPVTHWMPLPSAPKEGE